MTREEIKNTPELVDFMLDKSVIADSRMKLNKRLEEICDLAITAIEQQSCENCISRKAALEILDDYAEDIESGNWGTAYSKARTSMCDLPSVDPERKNGKWINVDPSTFKADCSCCGNHGRAWMKYCYMFGSPMEGGVTCNAED